MFVPVMVFGVCFLFASGLNAQNSRPTPTPIPDRDAPQIISRADEPSQGNRIITENSNSDQLKSLEDKIDAFNLRMRELSRRISLIESSKETEYDLKQKRLLLNLDILSKAEARAQNLRKQLIDMIEKENEVQTKIENLENDLRPEMIDRMVAFAGTLRPEELRERRRQSLIAEKTNLENLLREIQVNRADLEKNVRRADLLVKKLRDKLEGEIDKALADDDGNP